MTLTHLLLRDMPSAKVPDSWEQYFNRTNWANFTETEKADAESFVSRIFEVIYVKNSDEVDQKVFDQELIDFNSAGLTINLKFSDPLLVSQGEVSTFRSIIDHSSDFLINLRKAISSKFAYSRTSLQLLMTKR